MNKIQPKFKRIEACLKRCGSGDKPDCESCWYLGFRDCKGDLLKDAYHYLVNIHRVADRLQENVLKIQAAQPKWISVEKYKPKTAEFVLLKYAKNAQNPTMHARNTMAVGRYEYGMFLVEGCSVKVTHWMPLPQAPNDNKEE